MTAGRRRTVGAGEGEGEGEGGLVDRVMGLMGDIRWASMLGPYSVLE